MNRKLLFFTIMLLFFGCNRSLLPEGKYIAGEESITIKDSTIIFHIKLKNSPENTFWNKTLEHRLSSKRRIVSHTMRSAEYARTLLPFFWYWDGKNIIKTDKETGKKTVFHYSSTVPVGAKILSGSKAGKE